jgi:hypothetical protein
MKKLIYIFIFTTLVLVVSGCSLFNKDKKEESAELIDNLQVRESREEAPLEKNEDLTEKLKKEEILKDGQIYTQNEYAVTTMIVKDDATQEEIDELVDRYVELLKEKYEGKKVNVQAIQNGENVANRTVLDN